MSPYLTSTDADILANTLPALSAYLAATTAQKQAALQQACSDVDNAMPFQGRKLDPAQSLQFPRVAYESAARARGAAGHGYADTLWDWDPSSNAPIVPADVKAAVLYQADAILAGQREQRLDKQHDGVAYDQTAGLAESYKSSDRQGLATGLTRRAYQLLQKYRVVAGRIL